MLLWNRGPMVIVDKILTQYQVQLVHRYEFAKLVYYTKLDKSYNGLWLEFSLDYQLGVQFYDKNCAKNQHINTFYESIWPRCTLEFGLRNSSRDFKYTVIQTP